MKDFKFVLLLLSLSLAFNACKKEDSDTDQLNNHLQNCPGKFEGQYIGNIIESGSVIATNVTLTVLTYVGDSNKITFVLDKVLSDTISGTMVECDLKSFTFQSGFGSFSEDGNTLTFNYDTYWSSAQGTFTKIKTSGFLLIAPDFTTNDLIFGAGESITVPIHIRRFGGFNKEVSLRVDSIVSDNNQVWVTASFNPANEKPSFNTVLTIQSDAATPNSSYHRIYFSASDNANTYPFYLTVKVYNDNCVSSLVGNYSSTCWWDYFPYSDTVLVEVASPSNILIKGLFAASSQITVSIDCQNEQINIPRQAFPIDDPRFGGIIEFEVEGSGSFIMSQPSIVFNISWRLFLDGSIEDDCNGTLSLIM